MHPQKEKVWRRKSLGKISYSIIRIKRGAETTHATNHYLPPLVFRVLVNRYCITSLSLYCGLANGKEIFIYAIVTEHVAEDEVVKVCRCPQAIKGVFINESQASRHCF